MFFQLKKRAPVAKTTRREPTRAETANKVVFYAGTKIATDQGWQAVEDLEEGQRVRTADNQEKEITDLGHEALKFSASREAVRDWPIIVPAGAIGNKERVVVSPDLRVVIENPAMRGKGASSRVSVRAETLIGFRGIARAPLYADLKQVEVGFGQATTLVMEGGVMLDMPGMSGEQAVPPLNDRQSRVIMHSLRRADLRRIN